MEEDPLSICYCGWGYNRPMIRCCHCRHWYHCDCVNVTRRILEDPDKWYCFECIDFKPNSDNEEDYDFMADVERRREMNLETRKGVKRMLQDTNFSAKSVMSMSQSEIERSICCIEQQLLVEDDSPLIHTALADLGLKQLTKYQLERKDRYVVLQTFPYLYSFLIDAERHSLMNCVFSVSAYVASKESGYKRKHQLIVDEKTWMKEARSSMIQLETIRNCIPIHADVRTFDWRRFGRIQESLTGSLFDVVLMDPPWQLTNENPCRGVAIKYQQLNDKSIAALPLQYVQKNGLLFMWTINSKFATAIKMIANWGYQFICDIAWVKLSVRVGIAQGNGYYLHHAKETCLVAKKGKLNRVNKAMLSTMNEIIYAKRKGQSQKPDELYNLIEQLVPNGYYLELFGRLNNLRDNWVTIGNEI